MRVASPNDSQAARATLVSLGPWLMLPVLVLFVTVGTALQISNRAVGLWLSGALVFMGVPFVALRVVGLRPAAATLLTPIRLRELAFGVVVGAVNYAAWAVPLMALSQAVLPKKLVDAYDGAALFASQTPVELALLIGAIGIGAPVCEEVFFRGTLQQSLLGRLPGPRAVVVTALLFGLFHFDPVGLLPRFELGVVFGLLTWRTKSLWAGIGAHAANNLVSSAAYFASGGSSDIESELPFWLPITLLLVGNALLALLVVAVQRAPQWLPSREDAPLEPTAPGQWRAALMPFVLLLAAGMAIVGLVDSRGIALNWVDATTTKGNVAAGALSQLRAKARRGEASIEEYSAARQALEKK